MPSTKKLMEFGISETTANSIVETLDEVLKTNSPDPRHAGWQKISKDTLRPDMPFGLHKLLFESVFADTEESGGPHPAWFPTQKIIDNANVTKIRKTLGISTYEELLRWSVCNRGLTDVGDPDYNNDLQVPFVDSRYFAPLRPDPLSHRFFLLYWRAR